MTEKKSELEMELEKQRDDFKLELQTNHKRKAGYPSCDCAVNKENGNYTQCAYCCLIDKHFNKSIAIVRAWEKKNLLTKTEFVFLKNHEKKTELNEKLKALTRSEE